jgi:hypothetical protein
MFGIALFKWSSTAHWHDPFASAIYFGFALLFFLFVRALFRGRSWARGITLWLGGLTLVMLPFTWQNSPTDALFMFQTFLQAGAVVALLFPSSRRWFSQLKKVP